MHTEETAKKLWCPMVRFNDCDNRSMQNEKFAWSEYVSCIASDCMMWRWENVAGHAPGTEMVGYCGLAGRP